MLNDLTLSDHIIFTLTEISIDLGMNGLLIEKDSVIN